MGRSKDVPTKLKLTVACPNCPCALVEEDSERLALLLLRHIYTLHCSNDVNNEFKSYVNKKAKLTKQQYCLECCGKSFTAFNISTLANDFKEHMLMTEKHNKQGFHNMLEYVYDNARKRKM